MLCVTPWFGLALAGSSASHLICLLLEILWPCLLCRTARNYYFSPEALPGRAGPWDGPFSPNLLIKNDRETLIIALQRALGNVTPEVLQAHRKEGQHHWRVSSAAGHLGQMLKTGCKSCQKAWHRKNISYCHSA